MSPHTILTGMLTLVGHLVSPAIRSILLALITAAALRILHVRNPAFQLAAWTGVLYAATLMPFLALLGGPSVRLPFLSEAVHSRVPATTRSAVRSPTGTGSVSLRTRTVTPLSGASYSAFQNEWSGGSDALPVAMPNVPTLGRVTAPRPSAFARYHAAIAACSRVVLGLQLPHLVNRRLVAIYFLLLTFLLGRLVLGQALSRHLRRQSRPVQDPKARAHNQQAAMRVGLKGPPELAESSAICVPVTLGVLRPVILIPTEWRDWSEAKLVVVMVHEISHIRRKDSLTRLVALVYQCFFWFSPLAWWLAAKLAELAEQASDQAAIRAGTEPTFYAEVLLDFIRSLNHHQRRTCWQAVPMARGGRAHERIGRILASQETLMNELRKPVLILFAAFAAPFVWLLASCHPVVVARPLLSQAHAPLTLHGESEGHILLLGSLAPLAATSATPSQSLHIGSGGASAIASRQPVPAAAAPQSQHDEQRSFHSDWDMDIAIISPRSIIAFGSSDDREHAATLREKMPGEFIWFLHDGNSFLIRDARTVQAAKALAAPMEELEKGQAALGKQEEELRSRQVELDEKMKAMRVNLPADLAARQDRLKTLIQQIRPTASRQQLAGLERHLGELQGEIGQLEGKAGTVDGAVGVWERSLAAQEGKLGRQEREFGKQEVLVAKETSQRLQALLDSALANGLAKSERR